MILYNKYPFYALAKVTFLSWTSLFYNMKEFGWIEFLGMLTIPFDLFFDGNRITVISSFLLGVAMAAYPVTAPFAGFWLV